MVWLATLCIRRDGRSILGPVLLSMRLFSGPEAGHRLQRHPISDRHPDGQDRLELLILVRLTTVSSPVPPGCSGGSAKARRGNIMLMRLIPAILEDCCTIILLSQKQLVDPRTPI